MSRVSWPLVACMLAGLSHHAPAAEGDVLYRQKETVHLRRTEADVDPPDHLETAEPKQTKATAVRISGYVRAEGVRGVRGRDFLVVTNLTYERTPVFWYTILYPETGTHPWQYVETVIRRRLPVQRIEVRFRLKTAGEAWFRDFRIAEVADWAENADLVVATLGDSTGVMAYLPDEQTVWYRLEEMLRDRFPKRHIRVRCLAESGEYLKSLLGSGRLERELDTLERCDVVVIRYGLNDNGRRIPLSDFRMQLIETCERVEKRFPGVQIVLSTTIPPSADAYDTVTRDLAAERGLPLIDLNAFLRREAERGNSDWHTAPGRRIGRPSDKNPPDNPTGLAGDKHPNAYGGLLIASEKFRILEPIVEKRFGQARPAAE